MAPKSSTLGQGITIQYLGGPFVAILGHFGPYLVHFGVILAARARGWGQFEANFSPFRLFKTLGPFAAILGHFGVIFAVRARGWGQL